MHDLTRPQLLGYLAVGLVVVVLGALWVRGESGADRGGGAAAAARTEVRVSGGDAQTLIVHVAGAVRHPGVYRLPAGSRVAAAVRRAGGTTRRADVDALNLAARLTDGRQVLVVERPPVAGGPALGGAAAGAAPGTAGGPPLNLNAATAEELAALDGIGPATAAKIVAYRQDHGGFGSVDELDQVPGIGPGRLAALRDHVTA